MLNFASQRYKVGVKDSRFPMFDNMQKRSKGFPTLEEAKKYMELCEDTVKKRNQPWFTFYIVDTLGHNKKKAA